MPKNKPKGFFTDKNDGKVKPLMYGPQAATPLRTSKFIDPSREQVHQLRSMKTDDVIISPLKLQPQLKEIYPQAFLVVKDKDRYGLVQTDDFEVVVEGNKATTKDTGKKIWILSEADDFLEHQKWFESKTDALRWVKAHNSNDLTTGKLRELSPSQTKLQEYKEFEAAVNQHLNEMKLFGEYREKIRQDAMKEKHDHPWMNAQQAVLVAREEEDKVLRHDSSDPFDSKTKEATKETLVQIKYLDENGTDQTKVLTVAETPEFYQNVRQYGWSVYDVSEATATGIKKQCTDCSKIKQCKSFATIGERHCYAQKRWKKS